MQPVVLPLTGLLHNPMPNTQKVIAVKLVKKILALEYVDIAELQSEHWGNHETESTCYGGHSTRSTQRTPVSNILTWLDRYASSLGVKYFGKYLNTNTNTLKI